ncbi:MAG: hypothetical protein OIF32_02035 [Campylobacterales bacterium]|nr:hypothetical protein [Campylobacterales bacterium]
MNNWTTPQPVNPFSSKIKNRKLLYFFENDEDIMDFSIWIHDYQHLYHKKRGQEKINNVVELLNKLIKESKEDLKDVSLVIEESNIDDGLFINFRFPQNIEGRNWLSPSQKFFNSNMIVKKTCIYIQIEIDEDEKKIFSGTKTVNDGEKMLLRKSTADEEISAEEYISEHWNEISDDVADMTEIEFEVEDALGLFDSNPSLENLHKIGNILSRLSNKINNLYSFAPMSYALSSLSAFLTNITEESYRKANIRLLYNLISALLKDLSQWRQNIFLTQSAQNIHYLDASFLSSCMQIEAILSDKEIVTDEEDDDLELF